MSEPQPQSGALPTPTTRAVPIIGPSCNTGEVTDALVSHAERSSTLPPAAGPSIARLTGLSPAERSSTLPPSTRQSVASLTCKPRARTTTTLTPDRVDEQAPGRRSSRLKQEEVHDFNAPIVLHESTEDKSIASDEVLAAFGFALCDEDTLWYHPQIECQSRDKTYCSWPRGAILCCCITTEITRMDETERMVRDLDPLGSLYHPSCTNEGCRMDTSSKNIMRLERGQLVTRPLTATEVNALRTRARGKWYGPCQDVYPRPVNVSTFSKGLEAEPVDNRRATTSNAAQVGQADRPPIQQTSLPISPDSLPASPASRGAKKRKISSVDSPSHSRAGTGRWQPNDQNAAGSGSNDHQLDNDNPYNDDDDFTDGAVLKDHLVISKRRFDWDRARYRSLQADLCKARQEIHRQVTSAQLSETKAKLAMVQLQAERQKNKTERQKNEAERQKNEADRQKIEALQEEKNGWVEEIRAKTQEVRLQKSSSDTWKGNAQRALSALDAETKRVKDLQEKAKDLQEKAKAAELETATLKAQMVSLKREKAAVEEEGKAQMVSLEREKTALKEEVRVAKEKADVLEVRGRRMFGEVWNKE